MFEILPFDSQLWVYDIGTSAETQAKVFELTDENISAVTDWIVSMGHDVASAFPASNFDERDFEAEGEDSEGNDWYVTGRVGNLIAVTSVNGIWNFDEGVFGGTLDAGPMVPAFTV